MRRNRRFTVSLRVQFQWAREGSATKRGSGACRNISTCGVYMTTRTPLPLGARVLLEIEVPPLTGRSRRMFLQGEGSVIRVEPLGRGVVNPVFGVAAAVHFYPETSRQILLCFAGQCPPAAPAGASLGLNPARKGPAVVPRPEIEPGPQPPE